MRRAVPALPAAKTPRMTTTAARPVPAAVSLSVLLWLAAIGAGVAEALVHLLTPVAPTLPALAARFGLYAVLAVLVLALRTGRDAVRWAVAVLLGGVGTASLVVEPIGWLVGGGSPAAFLAAADLPTLLAAGLRVAHVAAVVSALVLMFRSSANAWFRSR